MNSSAPYQLERHWAAELVREARRAARCGDADRASELLDWAMLLAPRAAAIERLRIEILLKEGLLDSAKAMIARRLLERPSDPLLLLLQARCALLEGDLRLADETVSRARALAPDRNDALELAAEIASRLGDHARTVDALARLVARNPKSERVLTLLSRALIDTGEPEKAHHAERLLLLLDAPPPALLAQSLLAQGRPRDAADSLVPCVFATDRHPFDDTADSTLALYTQALEACGDVNAMDALLDRVDPHASPGAALAAARIMLSRGRFRAAAAIALRIARSSAKAHNRQSAAAVATVAAALAGRKRLARRAMLRLNDTPANRLERSHTWADCWRRGLRGRTLLEQRSARGAASGGDPSPSVLKSLLRNAAATFEKRLLEETGPGDDDASPIKHDLATCRAALGQR